MVGTTPAKKAAMVHNFCMHASEVWNVHGTGNAHLQLLDEAALVSRGMLGAVQLHTHVGSMLRTLDGSCLAGLCFCLSRPGRTQTILIAVMMFLWPQTMAALSACLRPPRACHALHVYLQ